MKPVKIIVLLFVFSQLKIFAQTFDPNLSADLQHTIDSFQSVYNLKGISASVFIPNEGIWKGVTGVSHPGVPITPETGFAIASSSNNSKLFSGTEALIAFNSNVIQNQQNNVSFNALNLLNNIH